MAHQDKLLIELISFAESKEYGTFFTRSITFVKTHTNLFHMLNVQRFSDCSVS